MHDLRPDAARTARWAEPVPGSPDHVDREALIAGQAALVALGWDREVVGRFGRWLAEAPAEQVVRVHVPDVCAATGLDRGHTLDLLVDAAASRILELRWQLLCGACGQVQQDLTHLTDVRGAFSCGFCQYPQRAALDRMLEAAFGVRPAIRRTSLHDPAHLPVGVLYRTLCFDDHARTPAGQALREHLVERTVLLDPLGPGDALRVRIDAIAGTLEGYDALHRLGFRLDVEGAAVPDVRTVRYRLEGTAGAVPTQRIAPGPVDLIVENGNPGPAALFAMWFLEGPQPFPVVRADAVPAQQLLTNTSFRRRFQDELIGDVEGLDVRDLVLLFTDLTGSTAMYARMGDLPAYTIVQRHFARLGAIVARHGGAVVKTMGDAIMAAFTSPMEAVRASEEAHLAFGGETEPLQLKIGLHRGSALAVTANRQIDYFGQTVNLAARVQGLAGPGETCLSAAMLDYPEVGAWVSNQPHSRESCEARGLPQPVDIARVGPSGPTPTGDSALVDRSGDPAGIPPVDGTGNPTRVRRAASRP